MISLSSKLKGLFMEARVLAFVNWFLAACFLGSALAYLEFGRIYWEKLALALLAGFLIQAFPTHAINEIVDWKSGTDKKGLGGSKVIKAELLTIADLRKLLFGSTVLITIIFIVALLWHPALIVILGFIGLGLGLAYTAPPLKLSYRPFMGEYVIAFPAMVLAILGCFWIQFDVFIFSPTAVITAIAFSLSCVAIMMCYHTIDYENDKKANKRTSIVFLGPDNGRKLVIINSIIAIGLYLLLAVLVNSFFLILVVGNLVVIYQYFKYSPWDAWSIIKRTKTVGYWHIGSICLIAFHIYPLFVIFPIIVLCFYKAHYQWGKLPQPNDKRCPYLAKIKKTNYYCSVAGKCAFLTQYKSCYYHGLFTSVETE